MMEEERREKLRSLGREIRKKREELGLSLEDVAQDIKIRVAYLEAVESGNDAISVGKPYFRAFLKSYASYLGLDGTEYSRLYGEIAHLDEQEAPSDAGHLRGPAPGDPGKLPSGKKEERGSGTKRRGWRFPRRTPMILVCAALFIACLVTIKPWSKQVLQPAVPSGTGETGPSGHPEGSSPGAPGHPAEGGSPLAGQEKPGSEREATGGPAETEITRTVRGRSTVEYTVFSDSLRIVVRTLSVDDGRCWVRAACDGKVVFEDTLGPGSSVTLEARREVTLRLGKPWVAGLTINDKDMGPAGPFGPVLDVIVRAGASPR